MANNLQPSGQRFVNRSGAALNANSLVAVRGFDTQNRDQQCIYAQANGANNRADGWITVQVGNNRSGFYYTDYIVEGTTAVPVNTGGGAVGDPVYLSPTTPGGWTLTAPGALQDYQEVGTILSVNAVTGRIRLNLAAGGVLGWGPNSITAAMLALKPDHDIGAAAVGWINISAAVTDGDRVSINGRIYEFDTAAPPGAIGAGANVRVGVSGGGGDQANNAAGCVAALVAAINTDASREVEAADIGGNCLSINSIGTVTSAKNYAVSDTIDTGNVIIVSAATMVGATAPAATERLLRRYTFTAADITELAITLGTNEIPVAGFPSTSQPTLMHVTALRASAPGFTPLDLQGCIFRVGQVTNNYWVLYAAQPAAGPVFAAADLLVFELARRT